MSLVKAPRGLSDLVPRPLLLASWLLMATLPVWADPPASTTLPVGDPSAHGIKAENLKQLHDMLKRTVDEGLLPGVSLLIAHRGEIVFREAFGRLQVDQVVPIASSTKPITATALMILADQGKLRMDDPVSKYVPEFANVTLRGGSPPSQPILVGHCVSNASGITGAYTASLRQEGITLAESVRRTALIPLIGEPGKSWNYSGVAFGVAARVVEVVSGLPFERYLLEELFRPLGMTHSHFALPSDAFLQRHDPAREGPFVMGGGGLKSTLDDLARFLEMHRRGGTLGGARILSASAAAEMHQAHNKVTGAMARRGATSYGRGFFLEGAAEGEEASSYSHGGAFGSLPWVDRDRELVGVFLTVSNDAEAKQVARREVIALASGLVPKKIGDQPAATARKTTVEIRGDAFFINGKPTYPGRTWNGRKIEGLLMNSRTVQAIFDDLNPETRDNWSYPDTKRWDPERNTREFLDAMPIWREHGLLSVTLNLQGGNPRGYAPKQDWHNSAITPEGELRPEYLERLKRVLDRADELGMAPILGIFYFGQDQRLKGEAAVLKAIDNSIDWVMDQGYQNVLIEVNNECNVRYDHEILKPERVHELIERVRQRSTQRGRRLLVGTSYGGGTIPKENVVRASDFLLMHGNGVKEPARIARMVDQARAVPGYRPMPILFNEDDHFDFDQPMNNMVAAIGKYASWGYFDPGESNYRDGYQAPPIQWGINTERKKGFFGRLKEATSP